MTDSSATPESSPDGAEQPTASWLPEPAGAPDSSDFGGSAGSEHPELAIGAAFAGGLLAALILKRLAR